jgi:FKBP-type peptidyl-prolyl cis-trans isomerase FkpA
VEKATRRDGLPYHEVALPFISRGARVNKRRRTLSPVGPLVLCFALSVVVLVAASGCGGSSSTPSTPSAPFTKIDVIVGTGATATAGRSLTVAYTGWLYDQTKTEGKGAQFDTGTSFRFTLGIGAVIAGWDQGLPGMQVGGRRRLTIPPELAYKETGNGSIPGNASLVFDINLLNVQ